MAAARRWLACTARCATFTYSIAQHVEDVIGFIGQLDVGPVDLIGHRRGGHIAFRLAQRRPDLLRKLILAEPGAREPPYPATTLPMFEGRRSDFARSCWSIWRRRRTGAFSARQQQAGAFYRAYQA